MGREREQRSEVKASKEGKEGEDMIRERAEDRD